MLLSSFLCNFSLPFLSITSSLCYLCLAGINAVRRVERDCVASLNALWLCLAVSSSPSWGARRAQLAAQNSPFSWRVVGRKKKKKVRRRFPACTFLLMDWHNRCFFTDSGTVLVFLAEMNSEERSLSSVILVPKFKLYSAWSCRSHPDYINLTAGITSCVSWVGKATNKTTSDNLVCNPEKYSLVSSYH